MSLLHVSREKIVSTAKYIGGFFIILVGFFSIVFSSPPRTFHVGVGDHRDTESDAGFAYADVPYAESAYYAEGGYGGGEGEGEGEGEGK